MNQYHAFREYVLAAVVVVAIAIAFLSLSRSDARAISVLSPRLHRVGHFSCYVLLAFLCVVALAPVLPVALPRMLAGFAIATAFGVVMEYLQRFRPGRQPSCRDALTNAAGAALGALLAFALPWK